MHASGCWLMADAGGQGMWCSKVTQPDLTHGKRGAGWPVLLPAPAHLLRYKLGPSI
jgi:hypothetical protein